MFGSPRSAVDTDLVELAGGAAPLAVRAKAHSEAGRPLEALHLVGIALTAEPTDVDALTVRKAALEQLAAASSGSNLSETMWLKAEIADVDSRLAANQQA